ncbi:hypothetical protein MMC06_004694 [Schaereria dolodes]|nr:hypothetical protein [Schaereria dolodes]
MALPYPEGAVFLLRDALVERLYNFNPNEPDQFYGNMLIEHVWNRWTVSQGTIPNFDDISKKPHPRSQLHIGRAQGFYQTDVGHFPEWWINFVNNRIAQHLNRTFNAQRKSE